jgi:uncharacterized Tic20 family protein
MSSPEYGGAPAPLSDADQRTWSTLVHLGGLFLSFWSALIGYLVLKDRGEFVREETREALNFQITVVLARLVATLFLTAGFLLVFAGIALEMAATPAEFGWTSYDVPVDTTFIIGPPTGLLVITVLVFGVGYLMLLALGIADLVFCIAAAVATSKGTAYRYPFAIRFVR